ncbi:hypothetical protein TNCV_3812811 [Trichonephila clavipes]|nr:hypothetical protein TNCV_3812811 [Trichonephila clavipes]
MPTGKNCILNPDGGRPNRHCNLGAAEWEDSRGSIGRANSMYKSGKPPDDVTIMEKLNKLTGWSPDERNNRLKSPCPRSLRTGAQIL